MARQASLRGCAQGNHRDTPAFFIEHDPRGMCFTSSWLRVPTRRDFLSTITLAAAALPQAGTLPYAAPLPQAQPADTPAHATFQMFPAHMLDSLVKSLSAAPGSKDLASAINQALSITVSAEENKIATDFEFHAHRDHVFMVLEGTTRYHVGGNPIDAHQTKPGEWLASNVEAFESITLNKGDLLTIPRMTAHKRMTPGKVSLLLISATSDT